MPHDEIPKKIFQTWKTKSLDPRMQAAVQSWIDLNPEYEHQLFDNEDCRNFIAEYFSDRVLNAYDNLRPGAYKADLWRYCFLLVHGGVYVDIDTTCLMPLEAMIKDGDTLVLAKGPFLNFAIWQGFIACPKKHPLIQATLDHVVCNIERKFYGENGAWPTGPAAMGIAVNNYGSYPDRHPFVAGLNERGGAQFRLLKHIGRSKAILNDASEVVFHAKYDGYKEMRDSETIPYPEAWHDRHIYNHEKRSKFRRVWAAFQSRWNNSQVGRKKPEKTQKKPASSYDDLPKKMKDSKSQVRTKHKAEKDKARGTVNRIRGYATIGHSHRFVWFRNAKVATRSIKQVLETNVDCSQAENVKSEKVHGYFKFAFVRNPWDRLVSFYYSKILGKEHEGYSEYWGMEFKEFVDHICLTDIANADKHFRPQNLLLPVKDLDFIGRFENFNSDFAKVCATLNLPDSSLPHRNQSGHFHYSHYYDEKTRQAVADLYAEDIKFFGYTFEQR